MKNFIISKPLRIALLSMLFLLLFCVFYMINMNCLLTEDIKTHLVEVSQQEAKLAQSKLQKNLETLNILAETISEKNFSMQDIMEMLATENERNDFIKTGYSKLDGKAVTTDGAAYSVNQEQFFIDCLKGKAGVYSTNKNGDIIYAVPVYVREKITAVLFCTENGEKLNKVTQLSFFNDEGYSFIIQKDGQQVFNSKHRLIEENLLKDIKTFNNESDLSQFSNSIKNNATGAMKLKINNEPMYLGFAPVSQVQDWILVTVVPENIVSDKSNRIIKQTFIFVLIICGIFTAIILYILGYKKENEKSIYDFAYKDKLTGFDNFNKFYNDCEAILKAKRSSGYAVIYLDIDNFKIVNDTFGYDFGDRIIKYVAGTINDLMEGYDIFTRANDDYFIVLLTYKNFDRIDYVINRIDESLTNINIDGESQIDLVMSSGVYIVKNNETDVNKLINKANIARATIKGNPVKYVFYNEKMRRRLTEEDQIQNQLKNAIEREQLIVHYQPLYNLSNKRIIGFEALIRWNHMVKGFISPSVFIPLAKKSGMIVDIDRYVFEKICWDIKNWADCGREVLPVSVNVSRIQLYQEDLIPYLQKVIEKYKISPGLIQIELNEEIALNDLKFTDDIINKLKNIGIKVTMDDFGTGFSSLSCLKDIPIDCVKLDRTFLQDIKNDLRSKNIIKSIINLAKSLDLTVVAEGVETKEQMEFLIHAGCDIAQGYYFAKPTTWEKIKDVLNQRIK